MLREGRRKAQATSLAVAAWAKNQAGGCCLWGAEVCLCHLSFWKTHSVSWQTRSRTYFLTSRSLGCSLFLQRVDKKAGRFISIKVEKYRCCSRYEMNWGRYSPQIEYSSPTLSNPCPINFGLLPSFFGQETTVLSINFPISLCFLAISSEPDTISNVDCSCNSPLSVARTHLWQVHRWFIEVFTCEN